MACGIVKPGLLSGDWVACGEGFITSKLHLIAFDVWSSEKMLQKTFRQMLNPRGFITSKAFIHLRAPTKANALESSSIKWFICLLQAAGAEGNSDLIDSAHDWWALVSVCAEHIFAYRNPLKHGRGRRKGFAAPPRSFKINYVVARDAENNKKPGTLNPRAHLKSSTNSL